MRRKAAGHVEAVSDNQSHKVRYRSAVGRVGRQSTHCGRSCPATERSKSGLSPTESARGPPNVVLTEGRAARTSMLISPLTPFWLQPNKAMCAGEQTQECTFN